MKIAVFSAKNYDRKYLGLAAQKAGIEANFFTTTIDTQTVSLAAGYDVVCAFVNDQLDASTIEQLSKLGVRMIALRCAGFNNVDLKACKQHEIAVVRVPEYSPYSVAEHTFGLILSLNRKIHKAYNRVQEGNFALDGLMGFDLHGKTLGLVGAGKIGGQVARIAHGFGCRVLVSDPHPDPSLAAFGEFVSLDRSLRESDIVSLHCPLNPRTHHIINDRALDQMKPGVMLVNTSRGALIDTPQVISRLKTGQVGSLAIDVYEEEADMFFEDLSASVIQDDVFARLLSFSNVLITGHQAFFTEEALTQIATTTIQSIEALTKGEPLENAVFDGMGNRLGNRMGDPVSQSDGQA